MNAVLLLAHGGGTFSFKDLL
uniref:Uncharacterized protein n=1 Tax=Anguilla anguilla TaxID=7936 RepID=A0A0E9T5M3_ANGAN